MSRLTDEASIPVLLAEMSTREKISVIAGLVGYSQLNNFYIHFRSYFGVSPGTMRSYDPLAELEDAYL